MMRKVAFWAVGVLALAAANGLIAHKEHVLRTGDTMLLKLAPVDPRSLIQGDYMDLAYDIERQMDSQVLRGRGLTSGCIVVSLDDRGVAQYLRVHGGEELGKGEHLLRYRLRRWGPRVGADAFFFQEGHAHHYERAKYGELRVAPSGNSVLVGLRGHDLKPLGPGRRPVR